MDSQPEFTHGELMAVGFLVAFFKMSLGEAPLPDAPVVNRLELAEARLPAIIGRLQDSPDVVDNGRRFHDLAGRYLPRTDRERKGFITLLENLTGLEKRFSKRDLHVESVESQIRILRRENRVLRRDRRKRRHHIGVLEARIETLEAPDA